MLFALTRYHAQFPDVSIELSLSQRMPDLFDGTSDMAVVTASSLPDSELVSHLLGSTFQHPGASPDYVKRHGAPVRRRISLRTHARRQHAGVPDARMGARRAGRRRADPRRGPVQTNTAESLALAIRDGIGIGMLPLYWRSTRCATARSSACCPRISARR